MDSKTEKAANGTKLPYRIAVWAPVRETEEIPPLGPALEEHLIRISNPVAKHASCSAWQLLYRVLYRCGLQAGTVCFEPGGKPYFAEGGIHFSITHSGGLCAVTAADVPTGVDVERVRADYRPALVQRVLSAAERAGFDGAFARLWCRKECIAKLTGRGVGSHPAKIDTLDPQYTFLEHATLYDGAEYRLAAAFLGAAGPAEWVRYE